MTDLLAANAVTADQINAGSVTAEKIAAGSITTVKLAAEAVTAEKIDAGAVTADKIAAGAVEASKIAALAITTEKLAAGAVTAEKIGAGSITAAKIDTTDLTAINATLGTAAIADARIALADIDFAKVKDLNAQSAYFGQAVIQAGVANKLFIPRLSVDYAQVVSATIGDLVIQATDNNYYKLDVDLDGKVTATQVTPSAAEIAQGHTSDGRTIYMGTDIVADDLNTTNIYASHALMDEITANIINVDKLFAREATITKINAMDLSSNTYIQATVGNWQSQSTITQTISSIQSRISELGYGTVYYSTTEPSHSGLVQGDLWIQPLEDNTWDDVRQQRWQDLIDGTWSDVIGAYKVYTWTGEHFKPIFDSLINVEMQTQIDQNTYAITLKADQSALNTIEGTVAEFGATLEIQSEAITAAVSAVNTKVSSYVMWDDPRTTHTVSLGDIWIKSQNEFGSWLSAASLTWDHLKTNYTWGDALVSETYVWDGEKWVQTSDRATSIQQETEIRQTSTSISMLTETTAKLGDDTIKMQAQLTVAQNMISQEVSRATTAEGGKLDKTRQYQTADQICSEAVRQAGTDAAASYIAKTTQLQTADQIYSEAVRQAGVNTANGYIAKTAVLQTADEILSSAKSYTNNKLTSYSTISQTSSAISAYVASNAYLVQSGIDITAQGISVSGSQFVKIESGGYFQVTTGNFGINTNSSSYVIWSGASAAASSYFRVKKDGTVYLTKLIALGENGSETEVNLRTVGLWKLNYQTVKSWSETGGYCTSVTFSNGTTVNFNSAGTVTVSAIGYYQLPSYSSANRTYSFGISATASNGASRNEQMSFQATAAYNDGYNTANAAYSHLGNATLYFKYGDNYVSAGSHDWYYK